MTNTLPKPAFVIEVNDEPDIPVFTAEQMREFRGSQAAAVPDVTLTWIADRLVNVYRENPNTDFVLALRRAAVEKAEMLSFLEKLSKVGTFYSSAIELDMHESGSVDGEELGKELNKLLRKAQA